MFFFVIGVALLIMKLVDFGAVAEWSWWLVLSPFGLALAWWAWADYSGLTRRREMAKDEARKVERRERNIAALGLSPQDRKRPGRR